MDPALYIRNYPRHFQFADLEIIHGLSFSHPFWHNSFFTQNSIFIIPSLKEDRWHQSPFQQSLQKHIVLWINKIRIMPVIFDLNLLPYKGLFSYQPETRALFFIQ